MASDDASDNRLFCKHMELEYAGHAPSAGGSRLAHITIFVVNSVCYAHQLNICTRSALMFLGGNQKNFVGDLRSASNIFGMSAHFLPMLRSVAKRATEVERVESTDPWAFPASAGEQQLQLAFVRFLFQRSLRRLKLNSEQEDAVCTFVRICNQAWLPRFQGGVPLSMDVCMCCPRRVCAREKWESVHRCGAACRHCWGGNRRCHRKPGGSPWCRYCRTSRCGNLCMP